MIPGPAGHLEALLEWAPEVPARLCALVCHPHPLYGGTLHNKVVFRAAKSALVEGVPALRFNFRGVGKSSGVHDRGVGELDDVGAALDYLAERFAGRPVLLMGFSFGCWVGLRAGARDARVTAMAGLGLPTIDSDFSSLRGVAKPKLIVQGTHDQYGERQSVQAVFDNLAEPKRLHWVEGADHFFTGRLGEVQEALQAFVREALRRVAE